MRPYLPRPALFVAAAALLLELGAAGAAELAGVERALDGDSLLLAGGREVRLIGINTPEFGRNGAPDQSLAAAAHGRAQALVQNRTVRLRYGPEREDHYGRTLAYVELSDGRELQKILLEEGLAWFVAIAPNVSHVAAYRAAEEKARRLGRGVWGRQEYEPVPAERLTAAHAGFRRVAGTVRGVRPRGDALELYLARRVRLIVPRSVEAALGPSPAGRRVVARGWLSEYKRVLRMRITHPSMLEVVP